MNLQPYTEQPLVASLPLLPTSEERERRQMAALRASMQRRLTKLHQIGDNPILQAIEIERCRRDTLYLFDNWAWTYDPRNAGTGVPSFMPFDLWQRQREMVVFILGAIAARQDRLVEKSRDSGFSFACIVIAWQKWRYVPGFKTLFTSYLEPLVDKIGNPDALFEKLRMFYRLLPPWFMPQGFSPREHDNFCQLTNPENGNVISGGVGDNIGRAGRSSMTVIDEAAFLTHAEDVEVATSATSDVRIWGSTANGPGNVFYRKRQQFMAQDPNRVFRIHFRDDPRKDAEWEANKRANYVEPWMFASEYDIDYSASVEGICIPGKWVEAAKRIRELLAKHQRWLEPAVVGIAGQDIGAGKARSVQVQRFGPIVLPPVAWDQPDTTETAHLALEAAGEVHPPRTDGKATSVATMFFDEPGVGKGVLSALSRHRIEGLHTEPVNTGDSPSDTVWPDGKTSKERFGNLKAELWWLARTAFKSTYEMMLFLEGQEGGIEHPLTDLISIPSESAGPHAARLAAELSLIKYNRNERGLIVMETKIAMRQRGLSSPDYADALVLTFTPRTAVVISEDFLNKTRLAGMEAWGRRRR